MQILRFNWSRGAWSKKITRYSKINAGRIAIIKVWFKRFRKDTRRNTYRVLMSNNLGQARKRTIQRTIFRLVACTSAICTPPRRRPVSTADLLPLSFSLAACLLLRIVYQSLSLSLFLSRESYCTSMRRETCSPLCGCTPIVARICVYSATNFLSISSTRGHFTHYYEASVQTAKGIYLVILALLCDVLLAMPFSFAWTDKLNIFAYLLFHSSFYIISIRGIE